MKAKYILVLFLTAFWGCSDSNENTGSGEQDPDLDTHGQAGEQAKSDDSSGGKTITTTANGGASGNPSQDKAKNQNWLGKDLLAEAGSREDGLTSSTQMLEKLLNDEMTAGNLINSRLVSKSPEGEIFYGADARPSVLAKKDGAIELTFHLELSFNQKAYYKNIVPRLTKLLDILCKEKIVKSWVRPMQTEKGAPRMSINEQVLLTGDSRATNRRPAFFYDPIHNDAHLGAYLPGNIVKKWPFNKSRDFFVATELSGNPSRTACRFAIYLMDKQKFLAVFRKAKSRILTKLNFAIYDSNEDVIWESEIRPISIIVQKGNEMTRLQPTLSYSNDYDNDDRESLVKANLDPDNGWPFCFTISPEFTFGEYGRRHDARHYASKSMVYSHKIELSKEDVGRIAEVKTYLD